MNRLKDIKCGEIVKVKKLEGEGVIWRCIMDMGIIRGVNIFIRKVVFFGDLIEVIVRDYELLICKLDVEKIIVE